MNVRQIHNELWSIRGDAIRASNCLHNGSPAGVEQQLRSIESRMREIRRQLGPSVLIKQEIEG